MGTLYFIELILLGTKFITLYLNKNFISERVLAWLTVIVAISAALVLGSVFGTVIGRVNYVGSGASVFTLLSAMASGIALTMLLSNNVIRTYLIPYFKILVAVLFSWLILTLIYQLRSSVDKQTITVSIFSLALLLSSILLVSRLILISSVFVLIGIFYALYKFVIDGQIFTLGPKITWFGVEQIYSPNVYEGGVFILGISMSWLVYLLSYKMLSK